MKKDAYDALNEIQANHWWHLGARAAYRTLIDVALGHGPQPLKMLDLGCGTGGNLSFLSQYGPTVGIEISSYAIHKISRKPELGLVQASVTALPFATAAFDGVHLLGVIEHLEDDLAALCEAARVCKPSGAVMLLTSALPILWSHHDVANQHKRRYRRADLVALFKKAGLTPVKLSYQNFFTLVPTLVVRMVQRWTGRSSGYDPGNVPEPFNTLLAVVLRFEAFLMRFVALPIGVDLVAACRPRR